MYTSGDGEMHGVRCSTPPTSNINYFPIIEQIRSDLSNTDKRGLLWLLDEETLFPGATDKSFIERLMVHHGAENDRCM